eukprot:751244-Hanusia_phi.AAC.3
MSCRCQRVCGDVCAPFFPHLDGILLPSSSRKVTTSGQTLMFSTTRKCTRASRNRRCRQRWSEAPSSRPC